MDNSNQNDTGKPIFVCWDSFMLWWINSSKTKRIILVSFFSTISSLSFLALHYTLESFEQIFLTKMIMLSAGAITFFAWSFLFTNLAKSKFETEKINKQLEEANEKLAELSITDALTGLYNERFIPRARNRLIRHASRIKEQIVCVIIDIDNFKQINDRFGHPKGDFLLKVIAETLKDVFRIDDYIFRKGGDEFMVLSSTIHPEEFVRHLEENILSFKINMPEKSTSVTFSYGIAFHEVDDKLHNDDLLTKYIEKIYESVYAIADMNMYEMKRKKKEERP